MDANIEILLQTVKRGSYKRNFLLYNREHSATVEALAMSLPEEVRRMFQEEDAIKIEIEQQNTADATNTDNFLQTCIQYFPD